MFIFAQRGFSIVSSCDECVKPFKLANAIGVSRNQLA